MSEVGHLELPQAWAETEGSGYEAPATDPGYIGSAHRPSVSVAIDQSVWFTLEWE